MDKQVDINDPQQYTEEWFNIIAIPIGKEFELPNVSSTIYLNGFASINFPMRNLQTHVHSFFNSYQVCPNRSMHMRYQPNRSLTNQEALMPGVFSSPWLVPKQEPQILHESYSSWLDIDHGQNHSKPEKIQENPTEKKITRAPQTDTRGNHKCFMCNISFGSGNALGGHMSFHAKKRKREAMRNISRPFNSDNSFFDFVDRLGFKDPSTPAAIVSTITSNSMAPTNMKDGRI
jgi:hypothetical protein